MNAQDVGSTVTSITTDATSNLIGYIPQLIGGLILLIIGMFLSSFVKKGILTLYNAFNVEKVLKRIKLDKSMAQNWVSVLAELARWTVLILFLVPAVEAFGVPEVTSILNDLLSYIPNVFVAVVIGFVGFIAARMVHDVVHSSLKGLGSKQAKTLSLVAKYAVTFFTALIILEQLGVAAHLVRILFTGIVAMITIAGGLAFGLGGKDVAKDILERMHKKVK